MRLLARLYLLVSFLFIVLYGVLPGFFRIEGNFVAYYVAGKCFLAGADLTQLYRFPAFQQMIAQSGLPGGLYSFASSPPAWIIAYSLLGLTSPVVAKFLLAALSAVLFVPLVHIAASVAKSSFRTAYIVFFSSSFALGLNFRDGEPFVVLTFLLVLAFFSFDMNADAVTGLILGFIFPFEPFSFIPAVLFLLVARWRVFAYFVATAVLGLALVFVMAGQNVSVYYIEHVLPFYINGRVLNPFSSYHQTAWSFFRHLFVFNETLNTAPFIGSFPLYLFMSSLFKSFVAVPSAYFFYKGVEKGNIRDALVAASFPIVFLSPTGSTVQMVLLAPAVVCIAQTALDEHRRKTAGGFIALYAAICLPIFSLFEDYFHIASAIPSYERFLLLFALYVSYLIFQVRLIPRESWTVRGAITGGLIAAVAVTLYFGDHSVQTPPPIQITPALDSQSRLRPSFSPAMEREQVSSINYDPLNRSFSFPGRPSNRTESGDCFAYSSDRFGRVFAFQTISSGRSVCEFVTDAKINYFPGDKPIVSCNGDHGAFMEDGRLFITEISGRRVSVTDTLSYLPFRIECAAFNSAVDDEIDIAVDSLNEGFSLVSFDLIHRSSHVSGLDFPVTHIGADDRTIYATEEIEDTTNVWSLYYHGTRGQIDPRKLFSIRGDIIDLAVMNGSIYFSSDFGRGLDFPTVYRYTGESPDETSKAK